jgi:hypothetical protein
MRAQTVILRGLVAKLPTPFAPYGKKIHPASVRRLEGLGVRYLTNGVSILYTKRI